MATVRSLTAERMLAIEAASVVDGEIVGENLILTKYDGSTIDAGPVRGVQGPQGPAGLDLASIPTTPVLEVGMAGQIRAGHVLSPEDFTTICGLPTIPVGLFGLGDISNLGTGPVLVNKGGVAFGSGILDAANEATVFDGSAAKALYIADTGAGDPFRIRTGSWGCWFRTAKRGTWQYLVSKHSSLNGQRTFVLAIRDTNIARPAVWFDGSTEVAVNGTTDICDDRWHFAVATFDRSFLRLYIDGNLESEGSTGSGSNLLFSGTGPVNIGSHGADAATAAGFPMYGRIDEAFITPDVLTEDQIRLLYSAKISHGLTVLPKHVILNIRRRRRGVILAAADFPSQPARLYNLVNLNDLGSDNVPLTANQGTGVITQGLGPDGSKDSARSYAGAHSGDSGTDAGLPAALAPRSYGAWFKTIFSSPSQVIMTWANTQGIRVYVAATTGFLVSNSVADAITGPAVNDGLWHHFTVVEDNAAVDGVKRKLYLDGKFIAGSTVMNSITLTGANGFRIGQDAAGGIPFNGLIGRVFVYAGALTAEQVRALYYKGTQDLGVKPKSPEDCIEVFDDTDVYTIFDTIEGQNQVEMAVAV